MKANEMLRKMINSAAHIHVWYDHSQAHITGDEIWSCEEWTYCPGYCDGQFSPIGNSPESVLTLKRANAEDIEDIFPYAGEEGKISLIIEISRDLWEKLSQQGMTWYAQDSEEE